MVVATTDPGDPDGRPQGPRVFAVITPTYNRASHISGTIESLLAQKHPHWRHLVVDDGSTDDTERVVSHYVARDDRVIYLRRSSNDGELVARNHAYDQLPAEVSWITSVDSDDILLPEALSLMSETIERLPEVDFFRFDSMYNDGHVIGKLESEGWAASYEDILRDLDPKGEWTDCMHRRYIDEGMRHDERLRWGAMEGMTLRIAKRTPFYYVPTVVRSMSRDNESITRPGARDAKFWGEMANLHRVFLDVYGDDLMELCPEALSRRWVLYAKACARARQALPAVTGLAYSIAVDPWHLRHFGRAWVVAKTIVRGAFAREGQNLGREWRFD